MSESRNTAVGIPAIPEHPGALALFVVVLQHLAGVA